MQGTNEPYIGLRLDGLWSKALTLAPDTRLVSDRLIELLDQIFKSKTGSYRYAVITQLLAKLNNPILDTRSIQLGEDANDITRFDARSVCAGVVVPWEHSIGSPLGMSTDPYVNNPLRYPMFTDQYRNSQKAKGDWDALVEMFEHVQEVPEVAHELLIQALLIVRRIREQQSVSYAFPQRISIEQALACVDRFLNTRSGGARLQALGFAVFDAIGKRWGIFDDVHTEPVNVSDRSSGKAADVVCKKNGVIVMACEVKDRNLNIGLLHAAITTARLEKVTELFALIRGKEPEHEEAIRERVGREFANGMNIYLMECDDFFRLVLSFMGEDGRQIFLQSVVIGMDKMKLPFDAKREWATILAEL